MATRPAVWMACNTSMSAEPKGRRGGRKMDRILATDQDDHHNVGEILGSITELVANVRAQ